MLCENKTSDITINCNSENLYINGYDLNTGSTSMEADPGETDEDSIMIYFPKLEEYNITSVDEISFRLCIYDDDNLYDYDNYMCYDMMYLYPTGLTQESFTVPSRITTEEEQVVFDNEYGTLVYLGGDFSENGADSIYYHLDFCIENPTDYSIQYNFMEVYVDDQMVSIESKDVEGGRKSYYSIFVSKDEYEEAIKDGKINNIELKMRLGKSHDHVWAGGIVGSDLVLFEETFKITL